MLSLLSGKQTGRHSLTFALVRAFSRQLILITIPRLALVGFTVAQPFLVQTTLNYITHHATQPTIYGYGIILAFGLVYTGVAVSKSRSPTFQTHYSLYATDL